MIAGFVMIIWVQTFAIWFDLTERIALKFQSFRNNATSDVYIFSEYSPNLSKDPFSEAVSNIESRSRQLRVAWADYVAQLLNHQWCGMSEKKIWGILYYYEPEFRADLARSLKQEMWDYDGKKYLLTNDAVEQYCKEFYTCERSKEIDAMSDSDLGCEEEKKAYDKCITNCVEKYKEYYIEPGEWCKATQCSLNEYNSCRNKSKENKIWESRPTDVQTRCQEFFQSNYKEGQDNKALLQKVEVSQIWADKYRNNSTEDSAYDIMVDLWILAKLLYFDAQDSIAPTLYKTAVSYKMPNFSNSNNSQGENGDTSSSEEDQNSTGWWWDIGDSQWEDDEVDDLWWVMWDLGWKNGGSKSIWFVQERKQWSVSLIWWDLSKKTSIWNDEIWGVKPLSALVDKDWWYNKLVKWLNLDKEDNFYYNVCSTDDEPEEVEQEEKQEVGQTTSSVVENVRNLSDLSDEEYQELVDYMLDAVDQYTTLPKDVEDKISKDAWSRSSSVVNSTTPSELEEAANKIKSCYDSCKWLRIDQKASCMVKCSCWEIKSPFFDPEKVPWLGPIFVIKFCGVPAVNTTFSIGWKRIHSLEEWFDEVYGVVDKLSREWKLWKWTQQHEFLDSSTKQMNIASTFTFTINVELEDIANKKKTHSDQYNQKKMKIDNEAYKDKSGAESDSDESKGESDDANAERYYNFASSMNKWMDQQNEMWGEIRKTIDSLTGSSNSLYTRPCKH